jgi:hypothetical protein
LRSRAFPAMSPITLKNATRQGLVMHDEPVCVDLCRVQSFAHGLTSKRLSRAAC